MIDQQYVIFKLGAEEYGLEISAVESIVKIQAITSVPQAPEFIEGITNLRGRVMPVIDLRKRFKALADQPAPERNRETRIIVLGLEELQIGIIVDAVSEVLRLPEEQVEQLPEMTTGINRGFVTGVAKDNGRLIILLDNEKMITRDEHARIKLLAADAEF